MDEKRTGNRIVRPATTEERERYGAMLQEEKAGMEANKALGREVLAERRELSAVVAELKSIREQLKISLTELAERTGMTVSNLSRLENMEGPNPTIETLRRYAHAIGHRIEFAVVAEIKSD
jgi:DNA-binding Xre family transcriptional regulator